MYLFNTCFPVVYLNRIKDYNNTIHGKEINFNLVYGQIKKVTLYTSRI